MMKIKKYSLVILSIIFIFSFSGLIACDKSSETPPDTPNTPTPTIILEQTKIQLGRGEKKTISYTLKDVEGTPEWYSYDPSVAEVDPVSGEIKGVETGETTIVAYIDDCSASCSVLVSEQAVEIKELKIALSSTELTINADSQYNSMSLEATLTYEGMPIDAQITWNSSDEESVSVLANGKNAIVTALKNNATATITATVIYDGVTASASCEIICQGFYEVSFGNEGIKLFPGESQKVNYDLYVNGTVNDEEKANVSYSVQDTGIISVSSDGTVTAIKKGTTQVVLTYNGRRFELDVVVGEDVYVSTARQFMDIDGEDGFVRYVLQNDIDLSGYFKQYPSINKSSLIDSFGSVIDGRGYTVSGWHRLKNANDTGFNGIFNIITGDARISNLGVKLTVDTDVSAIVIANNNSGVIENCLFDVTVNSNSAVDKVLFNMNNGTTSNCVIKVTDMANGSAKFGISDSGIAIYDNVALIAESLTYGAPNGVMVNDNFTDCYYYESEGDFANKDGKIIDGNGVGESATLGEENYDTAVFTFYDGVICLKNEKGTKPYTYNDVPIYVYGSVNTGAQTQIQLPVEVDGETISYVVLDYSFSDVTEDTCSDDKFRTEITGEYYVITYVEKDGVYSYAMSMICVEKISPAINATRVMLGNGNTEFTVSVDGKSADDFNYYTSNAKVATISETGVITAITAGTATVSVAEKNGQNFYKVVVTVVNSYTEVSDYESFVTVLNGAIKGDYVVLTQDITIAETPVQKRYDENGDPYLHNGAPINYAFVIETFKGILDGQGYCINLGYDSDTEDVLMCGLFYQIESGAEIRNLYYKFTANYIPTTKYAAYTSTFVRICSGVIRSCYFDCTLYPTKSSGGIEGIIGYLSNASMVTPTAYIYDNIFKIETIVDGVIQDGGYAVRAGTANPYGYNNALVRNGSNNEFYGTCSFTSVLEGSGNIKYNTLYDFVRGRDGYFKSVYGVITKVSNGNIVYANWGGEWTIDENEILLCGRKVADVYFEEYNVDSGITIDDDKGVLSWAKEIGKVDIYINGDLKLTQNNNSFDVFGYIKANYESIIGEYKVIIDNGVKTGAILYKVIGLNSENFVSVLRSSNTKEAAMYKYYVFSEDVTINGWNGTNRGDFIGGAAQTVGYHVFDQLYGNVDAMGHSLNVNVNTGANGEMFGGFIGNNRCSWQNLVYNLNATYCTQVFGLFSTNAWSGDFVNCYFNINATRIDKNGNVEADLNSSVINTPRGSKFTDCIIAINQTEGSNIMFLGDEISQPVFKNVIFIRDTESSLFTLSQSASWMGRQFIYCYHYRTLNDFVKGGNGVLINVASGEEYSTKAIEGVFAYEEFDDVWTINKKGVKLFDNEIVKIYDTGDNVVNDDDIIG